MSQFDYDFDSIEIQLDGAPAYASGNVEISYSSSRPERSTGWRGGVEIESYGEMCVTIEQGGEELGPFFLRKGHPTFDAIVAICDADIEDAAKDHCRWD